MPELPILYIKPGCPWCDDVVNYLAKKKIPVKVMVVSGNREAMQEMIDLSGQSKAPTMWIQSQFLHRDFQKVQIILVRRNSRISEAR